METRATVQDHQQAMLVLLREFDRICKKLDIPYCLYAGTMLGAVRHQDFIPWDDDLDIIMLREHYVRFLEAAQNLLDEKQFFLQKEFSPHWPMFHSKLRLNGTTCLEKYHPTDPQLHRGIFIDIFPCDHAFNSGLGRFLQFLCSKIVIAKSLDRRGYQTDSKKKKLFIAICRMLPMRPFLHITTCGTHSSKMVHSFLGGASGFRKNVFPRVWLSDVREMTFADGKYPVSAHYDAFLRQLYGDYMTPPPEHLQTLKRHAVLVDLHTSYEQYEHYTEGMRFDVYTRSIR